MAEFFEVLKNRRSIRKYEEKEVPEEALQKILEAVQWTPSWANTQVWEVVVVKDQGQKEKLQETMGKGNPATKAIVGAPMVLALCGKLKSSGYYKDIVTTKLERLVHVRSWAGRPKYLPGRKRSWTWNRYRWALRHRQSGGGIGGA